MPEPFKNVFDLTAMKRMAVEFAIHYKDFDSQQFLLLASADIDNLSMKQRCDRIVLAMKDTLPNAFEDAATVILASISDEVASHEDWTLDTMNKVESGLAGWLIWPLTEFVGQYGQAHFATSMKLFHSLTQRFSAEFGIRHFLLAMPEKTLAALCTWVEDPSVHVRRLVSEGTRPTLPWGLKLPEFLQHPEHTFPLLNALKDDEEEYVRRSVANHLNDLSKVHPTWFADVAVQWMDEPTHERVKLVRHASRTLLKQGDKRVMMLFGFGPISLSNMALELVSDTVKLGDALNFTFSGKNEEPEDKQVMIDFVIHHQKANGTTSPKVFKWKALTLQAGESFEWTKKHSMKPVTTRKYYAGEHGIEILLNGESVAFSPFELTIKNS